MLDEAFELTRAGARRVARSAPAPIPAGAGGAAHWHNDVSRLFLDINEALAAAADERARDVLIRRLRRALNEGQALPPHR